VVFIDSQTRTKIDPSPVCLQFQNVSEVGCDDDLPDGQVDFLDLAVGTHEVTFSNMPSGWQLQARVSIPSLTIEAGQGPQIIYVGIDTGGASGSSGSSTTGGSGSGTGSTSGSTGTSTQGLEWREMVIGCDDPVACYGARIVVTLDGDPVGDCTITTDPNDTSHVHACSVEVPVGVTIQLHLDEGTLAAEYVAKDNDVSFETTYVGKRASHDFVFEVTTEDSAQSSETSAQDTWTASVQVILCDGEPGSRDMDCRAGAGVTVDISLSSGEWMGSCTTSEPQPTPWDVDISTCSVAGMPYHADFVAAQDPSTIPAGYVPHEDPLTLHVEDLHPGGGDQATFTFSNVRADAGSTGSGDVISGQGTFDDMVGEWYGKRRDVTLNADGTGVINYRYDRFGNGVTYSVVINSGTSPITATIVDATPNGDFDLSQYPGVGHTVTLELQRYPDGNLLVVEIVRDEWTLHVCSVDDEGNVPNVQTMCY
jgi:hypothetical protein